MLGRDFNMRLYLYQYHYLSSAGRINKHTIHNSTWLQPAASLAVFYCSSLSFVPKVWLDCFQDFPIFRELIYT